MSRRKKPQEESFETAEGFQIEDMEGNAVIDDIPLIDKLDAEEDEHDSFWDDEDDDEKEEDEYFNSVAENNDWEEGYDY